jgi:hypothetical protein
MRATFYVELYPTFKADKRGGRWVNTIEVTTERPVPHLRSHACYEITGCRKNEALGVLLEWLMRSRWHHKVAMTVRPIWENNDDNATAAAH